MERSNDPDMTVLGAVFLAGINMKLWTQAELYQFSKVEKSFVPDLQKTETLKKTLAQWKVATAHFSNWN